MVRVRVLLRVRVRIRVRVRVLRRNGCKGKSNETGFSIIQGKFTELKPISPSN